MPSLAGLHQHDWNLRVTVYHCGTTEYIYSKTESGVGIYTSNPAIASTHLINIHSRAVRALANRFARVSFRKNETASRRHQQRSAETAPPSPGGRALVVAAQKMGAKLGNKAARKRSRRGRVAGTAADC